MAETSETPQEQAENTKETADHSFRRKLVLPLIAGVIVVAASGILVMGAIQAPTLLSDARTNDSGEMLLMGTADVGSLPLAALLERADRALSTGDLEEAAELYERALEMGGDIQVMRRLFDTALLLGDRRKAESVLGLLSFRGVSETTLDALRGLVQLREGDLERAREIFSEEPSRPEQAYGLVLVNTLEGKHEEAQRHLQILLQSTDPLLVHTANAIQGAYDEFALFQDGKESHLLTLLARAFAQIGQCPAAETMLREVVTFEPDYRDAWIVLGYCQLMLQQNEEALASFEYAYTIDPEKAETQYFLGLAHERLGDATQATMFLGYALQNGFEPQEAVRTKLATLSDQSGSYMEAAEQYRALIDQSAEPTAEMYHVLVTLLIEKLDDVEGARELALEARDALGDVPQVLDIVGWTALLINELDEAASFLNAAVQQDPTLASAWYHLGLLEENVGSAGAAVGSFRKAYDLALGIDDELAAKAAEKHNVLIVGN